jgi:hypothetical protein
VRGNWRSTQYCIATFYTAYCVKWAFGRMPEDSKILSAGRFKIIPPKGPQKWKLKINFHYISTVNVLYTAPYTDVFSDILLWICWYHRYLMSRLSLQVFYLWRHVLSTAPPFRSWWSNLEILFAPLHRSSLFIGGLRCQAIQTEHGPYIAERTPKEVYIVICLWLVPVQLPCPRVGHRQPGGDGHHSVGSPPTHQSYQF